MSTRGDAITGLLTTSLTKLSDFKLDAAAAATYAAEVVAAVRLATKNDKEEFRDHMMGLIINVKHLEGEIVSKSVSPTALAAMDLPALMSERQRKERAAAIRKRGKAKVLVDKTSMLCTKCSLVRRDRLNINEVGLDSEENGSHFDYNFDNTCACSHSSEDDDDDDDSSSSGDDSPDRKRPRGDADANTD